MQKKLCYLLMGLIALIMISCDTNKFKALPITETLATYYEQDANGEWSLLGVKEMRTDKVIIKPDNYEVIKADENFISCVKVVDGMKQIWLYCFDGECVGWFDTLNHITSQGNYYVATNYNQSMYYFPKTKILMRTNNSYSSVNYLFIQVEDGWRVFTYDGDMVIGLPLESKIIHNLTSEAKETIYVISEEKGKITLFDIETEEHMTYSLEEWLRQFPNLRVTKELPHLTIMEAQNILIG